MTLNPSTHPRSNDLFYFPVPLDDSKQGRTLVLCPKSHLFIPPWMWDSYFIAWMEVHAMTWQWGWTGSVLQEGQHMTSAC